ncbi:MAG: serine/threonine protein kinase [Planctomycetes bacterium]|nr:serine/threonine protein kinase [Planctomycetota bacterium]
MDVDPNSTGGKVRKVRKSPPAPPRVRTQVTRPPAGATFARKTEPPRPSVMSALGLAPGGPDRSPPKERYAVAEELGRGGMGRVLRVEDNDLNREVAMKVLLVDEDATGVDAELLQRFVEEAQINSQLEHPNVLPVHDFGLTPEGELYFTMQIVRESDTIADVLDRLLAGDGPTFLEYSFERRVQIVQQVCNALHYAHERGVVHRDLKPENILIGRHGEVYLVDWGVAKLLDAETAEIQTVRSQQLLEGDGSALETQAGGLMGTPAYMAPEQVLGKHDAVDARTDTYALCAVLYEFLTLHYYLGRVEDSMRKLLKAILNTRPVDAEAHLSTRNGRVPRQLSRILRKGLEKSPDKRFQSAAELSAALQKWIEGSAPIVCPGTAMQCNMRKFSRLIDRRPVLVPAVTITLLVLLLAWSVTATVLALR